MTSEPRPCGVIILDKPRGLSSARAVGRVKYLLGRTSKVGHAGTLDPFATGVLLLLVGRATKCCEALMNQVKEYETTIRLDAFTATDDPTHPPQPVTGAADPGVAAIDAALLAMTGRIEQKPPSFSALRIGGRRAYELARTGAAVELAPRMVRIDRIERIGYHWPNLEVRITCGRGTYIRSIARELGERLGIGGHLTELRRTRIGRYAIENAVTIEQLTADGPLAHLLPSPVASPFSAATDPAEVSQENDQQQQHKDRQQ